jgi:hypothetical protein
MKVVALLACLAAAPAFAVEHRGLFLQMDLGVGQLSTSEPYVSPFIDGTISSKGFAGDFALSLGGSVAPNFAIYGLLYVAETRSPGYSTPLTAFQTSMTSVRLGALGAGFGYYFVPVNLFVTLAGGVAQVTQESAGSFRAASYTPSVGPFARLGVGKEWMLTDSSWGLGVAAYLSYARNRDLSDDCSPPSCVPSPVQSWTTWVPTLAFTATYY